MHKFISPAVPAREKQVGVIKPGAILLYKALYFCNTYRVLNHYNKFLLHSHIF